MKLTIKRDVLTNAFRAIKPAIGLNSPLPILTHALIQSNKDGMLEIVGSDLEVWATYTTDIPGPAESFSLRAEDLDRSLNIASEDEVTLELGDDLVLFKCGKFKSEFSSYSGKDYPTPLAGDEEVSVIDIPGDDFDAKTPFLLTCVASDDLRPALRYVMLEDVGTHTFAVAASGHRFASTRFVSKMTKERVLILPSVLRNMLNTKGDVEICTLPASQAIRVKRGELSLTQRGIDIPFPNVADIIKRAEEEEPGLKFSFDRTLFTNLIKGISSFAGRETPAIDLTAEAGTLLVTAQDPATLHRAETTVDADITGGGHVRFNPVLFSTMLSKFPSDKTEISFGKTIASIHGEDNSSTVGLLALMNIQ